MLRYHDHKKYLFNNFTFMIKMKDLENSGGMKSEYEW